jgi:Sulfotransferase domain
VSTSKYRRAIRTGRGALQGLAKPLKRAAKRSPLILRARDALVERYQEVLMRGAGMRSRLSGDGSSARTGGANPENMIWIFCTSRSGSSWLRSMMAELEGHKVWEEPSIGRLFGDFYRKSNKRQLASPNFIMGNPTRKGWLQLIRNFVLDGARYTHPFLGPEHYLVIKEPDSAGGAPLIMEALPESRMIFLIRDPRDVAASALDAARKGSWMYEVLDKPAWREKALADNDPDDFVRRRANSYLNLVGGIRDAYYAHRGRKVLVRYEDLKADPLETMKRIYSALEIPAKEEALALAVEKHSWESIPKHEKGRGKFYRKGTPGGWREDLTPEQVEVVERITAPLLEEFYP